MKKYLLLTILPILASCTSVKFQDPERPSKDISENSEKNLNKGLSHPHYLVDRSADASLDITEDSASLISGVGTRQVRNYGNTVVRSTRRGSHIVRKEGTRYAEVVYDAGDQVADVAHDETIAYGGFIDNGVQRTLHTGGTLVCGTFKTYSNSIDSATRGIFGGLLRCTVRDTKNYMVGSLNDQYPAAGLPGAGWRGPRPQLPAYQAEETSGKGVYTASK